MIEFMIGAFCLGCLGGAISLLVYFVTQPKSWWISLPLVCLLAYGCLETFDMFVRTLYAN